MVIIVFGIVLVEFFCGLCWRIYCKYKYYKEIYFIIIDWFVLFVFFYCYFFGLVIKYYYVMRIVFNFIMIIKNWWKNMFYDIGFVLMLGLNYLMVERKNVVKYWNY